MEQMQYIIMALANLQQGGSQELEEQQNQRNQQDPDQNDEQDCVFTRFEITDDWPCTSSIYRSSTKCYRKRQLRAIPKQSKSYRRNGLSGNKQATEFCNQCGLQGKSRVQKRIQGERLRHWISQRKLQNLYGV